MSIINLTAGQKPTANKKKHGVSDFSEPHAGVVTSLLTFDNPPTHAQINDHANGLLVMIGKEEVAKNIKFKGALIDGPSFMVSALTQKLKAKGLKVYCRHFGPSVDAVSGKVKLPEFTLIEM